MARPCNLITLCLDQNYSKSEIDVVVKQLTDNLNRATRYAILLERKSFKSMQIASSTHVLTQEMNTLQTQRQRTHDITLRILINSLKEQIDQQEILQELDTNSMRDTWRITLQGLDTNSMRDTWRITKSLTNTNPNIPPFIINGKTATTIQEKLNPFADNLEQILTTNFDVDNIFKVSTEQVVNDFFNSH
jgi:hypothetical protein